MVLLVLVLALALTGIDRSTGATRLGVQGYVEWVCRLLWETEGRVLASHARRNVRQSCCTRCHSRCRYEAACKAYIGKHISAGGEAGQTSNYMRAKVGLHIL